MALHKHHCPSCGISYFCDEQDAEVFTKECARCTAVPVLTEKKE